MKYIEKDISEVCWLNQYPMAYNHNNYKPQSYGWPTYNMPYLHNPSFTFWTIIQLTHLLYDGLMKQSNYQ